MSNKQEDQVFTRRAFLLGGLQLIAFGGLVGRLYTLQVKRGPHYRTLSELNRTNLHLLVPERGLITDRHGVSLAHNIRSYQATLVPAQVRHLSSVRSTLRALLHELSLKKEDVRKILRDVRRSSSHASILLKDNLTWKEVSWLSLDAPHLPGVHVDTASLRFYPFSKTFAHIIGYVGRVSPEERGEDPLLALPSFRIGKRGVEKKYDALLRGTPGKKRSEVDAYGRVLREIDVVPGQRGKALTLTLDAHLQQFVFDRIRSERVASAIALDVVKGDVLAMASSPSFDSNFFSKGITHPQWNKLLNNVDTPLNDRATSGLYAPGSTFKVITALAALESGLEKDTIVNCPGYLDFGDRRFFCWKKYGHGRLDMIGALRESCDVWFYTAALRSGIDHIAKVAHKLGLGHLSGLGLDGEKKGLIPTVAWKKQTLHQRWQKGETLISGIGQGYVLTTPLQLAIMTARLAGGRMVMPRLTTETSAQPFAPLDIRPAFLNVVREGLRQVVNTPGGTAYRAMHHVAGWVLAGKSGTSQVRHISLAEHEKGVTKNKDLPWPMRDHALFIAFAPFEKPRYAVSVVVEHGGTGPRTSAPIVRDILDKIKKWKVST